MTENLDSLSNFVLFLMPGFVAAWVMFGLTSHPKPSQFERLIQALILTAIVQSLMPLAESLHECWFTTTKYSEHRELWSIVFALLIGLLLAFFVNNDWFHRVLRKIKFTSRTSHPSEWFYVFSQKIRFVVIHLHDGRRLYGWPKEWPIDPKRGQLYLMEPTWLLDNNEQIVNETVEGILLDCSEIRFVEFMKSHEENNDE